MEKKTVALKPIKKKSLYLQISDSIYSYIRINNLQPGDKLPSERDMSAMLQTSRNSVREALRILEDRGLIYVKTGRGVYIKDPYGDSSTFSFCLTNCSMEEIEELQSTLDHKAILCAIERASLLQKQQLISIASEMVSLAQEQIYSHILDHSFHAMLYESSGNSAIHQMINKIRESRFVLQADSDSGNDSIWLPTISQHLDLANAIMQDNIAKAITAIDIINNYGFSLYSKTP